MKFADLKAKLLDLWSSVGKWSIISLGRGFFEFAFSSVEDMMVICATGLWNLKSDEDTTNRSFGHFARVLVDVDLKNTAPTQVLVERDGFEFFVGTEVENIPAFCSGCHAIGHEVSKCRRLSKREVVDEVAVPIATKTKPPEAEPTPNGLNLVDEVVEQIASKTKHSEAGPITKGINLIINLDIEKEVNVEGVERLTQEDALSEASNEGGNVEIFANRNEVPGLVIDPVNYVVTEDLANHVAARDMAIVGFKDPNSTLEIFSLF
ncbi:hypothetical protein Lalb_Chr10g0106351 [Lupinus albus]|uniref:DUF4283 domain-containing protein n=1 Tax=Lupinus albus TaxID=3870 RepID=A0A6A4PXU5_LUPAL|nr:hypothetical protein Lalb_Chr10g0106351 [Lupinus albus]